ncbi:hypothetical protein AYI68_g4067 [Smittium mucronatum]|uniref:Uncharacterized protein n=1 Tax=Smittium mucronatum TaxID=133383 RepID=A0A1R0GY67_9FUNG|nr:hypothetical protein AYI68_g4067 [Smittium mucronatum]
MSDLPVQVSAGQIFDAELSYSSLKSEKTNCSNNLRLPRSKAIKPRASSNKHTGLTTSIPNIPEFNGSTVGFSSYVIWVDNLFVNYPQLTDFNQNIMFVGSRKGEWRSWYDAEPDSSTVTWPALKDALLRQYGGNKSILNPLTTVSSMKLTAHLEFCTFIQRIRPAI